MNKDEEKKRDELIGDDPKPESRIENQREEIEKSDANDLPYHQMVLESISDAFFTLDEDLRLTHFNNKAEEVLGKKREEVLGKKLFDEAFPEAKGTIFENNYSEALKSRKKMSFEVFFEREPYTNWYEVNIFPLKNGIAVFFNVTTEKREREEELKAANQQLRATEQQLRANEQQLKATNLQLEALNQQLTANEQQLKASNQQYAALNQQLRESESSLKDVNERFDLAMRASKDGLYDWNLVTNEIYYSPGWKRMLGYQDDELPNDFTIWETLTSPEDVKRSWEMQKELINGERDRFEMEFRMKHKDGHWVDILSRAEAIFDEEGNAIRIVGTHVDISDMRNVMKELKEREKENKAMLSSMINAFVLFESVYDDNGNFISYRFRYINEAYEKITGVKNDDVKGKTVHDVWPETEPEWIKRYGEVAVTGKPQSFELYHDPTGKDYYCNVYRPYDSKDRFCVIFDDITDRKRNERIIKENERKFRSYVEHAPYGIFIADGNGEYVDVNPAAEKITGYSRDELVGMNLIDIIFSEDVEKSRRNFSLLKTERQQISNEIRYVRKDGEVRYWIVTATPLSNGRFLGFTIDITDRKEAEEKVRESEEKYRNLVQNSIQGIVVAQMNPIRISFASKPMEDICGFSTDELMSFDAENLEKLIHQDDRKRFFGSFISRIKGNKIENKAEYRIIHRNGTVRWVELFSSLIEYQGEKATQTVFIDITDRKLAENELIEKNDKLNALNQQLMASEEQMKHTNKELTKINARLKESERMLRDTGRMARVGGWELDIATNKVSWSEETYRIHEVPMTMDPPLEDAINFFHPDDRPILREALKRAIEEGEPYDLELRFITANGKELITHTLCQPVIEKNKVVKLYGTFQDITKLKEIEIEMQNAKEEVEFYMDLLGHDLGNIHQGISGSLQMLKQKIDINMIDVRILDLASESVNNATSLTKEVVLLSRLRDRKPELENLELGEILDDSMEQMRATFPDKEIDIDIGDIDHIIKAEPLVRELFINILHNAIRLQDDRPWIRMYAKRENVHVLVSIEDKGPGIPDSMKTDLFKRFGSKGEKVRRGLGLSIAKALAERYDGDIHVEDRVEGDHTKGARFVVDLTSS